MASGNFVDFRTLRDIDTEALATKISGDDQFGNRIKVKTNFTGFKHNTLLSCTKSISESIITQRMFIVSGGSHI